MISINPIEWYYRYCKVEPLWSADGMLAFRASIPFIEAKNYIRYSVESFPVPLNDSRTAQLDVKGAYGYDTVTGDMFALEKCVGEAPMVCDASVVYSDQGMKCTRGIIGGDSSNRDACPVKVVETKGRTMVRNVGLNNYIVVTWGEMVTKHCEGMPENKYELRKGVQHVFVNATCTLTGTSWKLVGIRTHLRAFNVPAMRLHVVKPFHLEQVVTTGLPRFQEGDALAMMPEIGSVSVGRLRLGQPLPSRWISGGRSGMLSWINLVGIVLVMCILLVVARRCVSGTLQGCIMCKKVKKVNSPNRAGAGVDDLGARSAADLITTPAQFKEHPLPPLLADCHGKTKDLKVQTSVESFCVENLFPSQ